MEQGAVGRIASSSSSHLTALDGARGLAILLVMGAHGTHLLGAPTGAIMHGAVVALNLGWCGVQLFFVLSGFLITRLLLVRKERFSRGQFFADFYARRALRIFPLYYLALAIFFVVRATTSLDVGPSRGEAWWYLVYLHNWYNAQGHFPTAIGHFWSLAIEEQFYVVWPWVVLLVARRSLGRSCVAVVAVVYGLRLVTAYALGGSSDWLYYATPVQVDGLAMGALLAVLESEGVLMESARLAAAACAMGIAGYAAIVVASHTTSISGEITPYIVGAPMALSLTFAGMILMAVGRPNGWLARAWNWRFLRETGRISYCLYIVHVPIAWVLGREQLAPSLGLAAAPIYLLASFAVASLSMRYFEQPFLRLKDRLRSSRVATPVVEPQIFVAESSGSTSA